MNINKVIYLILLVYSLSLHPMESITEERPKVEVTIETYKNTFLLYEPVYFKCKLKNVGSKDFYIDLDYRKIGICLTVSFSKDGKDFEDCLKQSYSLPLTVKGSSKDSSLRTIKAGETIVLERDWMCISPKNVHNKPFDYTFTEVGEYQIKSEFSLKEGIELFYWKDAGGKEHNFNPPIMSSKLNIKIEKPNILKEEEEVLQDSDIKAVFVNRHITQENMEKIEKLFNKYHNSFYIKYLKMAKALGGIGGKIDRRALIELWEEKDIPQRSLLGYTVAKDIWDDTSMDIKERKKDVQKWLKNIQVDSPNMEIIVKEHIEHLLKESGN
ncbi:MAG: hypothetical protein A2W23_03285 [Planctomycetes bacterium RBG_16_43_13]|nr:MAG: hypothetical protein A2W23_03285 [Planctomycetes bacterium RBG_16_43_13]